MKKICTVIMILIFYVTAPAQALKPVNTDMIREAQDYGRRFSKQETNSFLLPWTAYEEKALRINNYTDRAYIYSPYLLIALHAKDSHLQGTLPKVADSEKLLTNYHGFLTFEVTLHVHSQGFANRLEAYLIQGKRVFRTYQMTISEAPELIGDMYRSQIYLYFADKGIHYNKPVRLIITPEHQSERYFNFNLVNIR